MESEGNVGSKTYTVAVARVVVRVVGPGMCRYELQKDVAGGPRALMTLRTTFTSLQLRRFSRTGFAWVVAAMEMKRSELEMERRMVDVT